MRGTESVTVNGVRIYGFFREQPDHVQLRLSLDDWDHLGLCEGQRVVVVLGGGAEESLLLLVATRLPPVVWVELRPVAPTRASRAG